MKSGICGTSLSHISHKSRPVYEKRDLRDQFIPHIRQIPPCKWKAGFVGQVYPTNPALFRKAGLVAPPLPHIPQIPSCIWKAGFVGQVHPTNPDLWDQFIPHITYPTNPALFMKSRICGTTLSHKSHPVYDCGIWGTSWSQHTSHKSCPVYEKRDLCDNFIPQIPPWLWNCYKAGYTQKF